MHAELQAIHHELKRLRRAGVESIPVDEAGLQTLRDFVGKYGEGPAAGRDTEEPPVKLGPSAQSAPDSKESEPKKSEIPVPPQVILPEGTKDARMKALRKQAKQDVFVLSQLKADKHIVTGVGNLDARVFFCGEAPGAEEEIKGEPFVGPAGDILTRIIEAMGMQRTEVYIGNIMIYRPPMPGSVGNRPPSKEEIAYCLPYITAQLQIVRPELIVTLGATALNGLLGVDPSRKLGRVRGQWFEFEGIPLLPTYHPSYILHQASKSGQTRAKKLIWEDMQKVMKRLAGG